MTRPHGMTRYRRGPDEHGNPGRGCRCKQCRATANGYDNHRRRMVAYGRWEYPQDATGTRRRLQALMRCGWSLALLSARLGCSRQELRIKLHDRRTVSAATARAVRALYDELWDQAPPEGTTAEKSAVTKTRKYARKHGFPPPLAWDDDAIDDPAAVPVKGWERREGACRYGLLLEEVEELIGFGEEPWAAAERLGVSQRTLERALSQRRAAAGRRGGADERAA